LNFLADENLIFVYFYLPGVSSDSLQSKRLALLANVLPPCKTKRKYLFRL